MMADDKTHLVLVNVDAVQLLLLRAARASTLLRLFEFPDDADKLDEAAELLRQEIDDIRRIRKMNTFWKVLAFVAVLLLVFVAAPSLAQEVTPVAAYTILDESGNIIGAGEAPVIPVQIGSDNSLILAVGLLLFFIGGGAIVALQQRSIGRLVGAVETTLSNTHIRNEAEYRYMESSIGVKDAIQLIRAGVTFGSNLNIPIAEIDRILDKGKDFLDKITDGQPNLPPTDSAGRSYEPGNSGPLPEGLAPRRDFEPPPGTTFGEVKPGDFLTG